MCETAANGSTTPDDGGGRVLALVNETAHWCSQCWCLGCSMKQLERLVQLAIARLAHTSNTITPHLPTRCAHPPPAVCSVVCCCNDAVTCVRVQL